MVSLYHRRRTKFRCFHPIASALHPEILGTFPVGAETIRLTFLKLERKKLVLFSEPVRFAYKGVDFQTPLG